MNQAEKKDAVKVAEQDFEIGRLLREYRNALYTAFEIVQELQKHGYERPWLTASAPAELGFGVGPGTIIDLWKSGEKQESKMVSCRIRLEVR